MLCGCQAAIRHRGASPFTSPAAVQSLGERSSSERDAVAGRRGAFAGVRCSSKATATASVATSRKATAVVSGGNEKRLAEKLRLGSLVEDGLSYKESFIVRCYEVGINKTATVETIANLLQEVGGNHAQSVGFSTDGFATTPTMRKLHLIWVTSRMHIEIYKYPAWSDVVEIETWCQGEGKIGTRRDWLLKDLAIGKLIGRATSKWVMMNQDTRKLQRVSDEVKEEYLVFCPRTLRSRRRRVSIYIPRSNLQALHARREIAPSIRQPAMSAIENKSNNGVSVVATFTHVCSCKSCAKKIKKIMERKQGVESADIVDGSTVVAKGAFDPEELRDHVFKKTKKNLIVLHPETGPKDRDEKANGAGSGHPEEEEVIRSTRQRDHLAGEQAKEEVAARQKAPAGDHTDAGRTVETTKDRWRCSR